jgi:hypothetical protein
MELLVFALLALLTFVVLAAELGSDSRPVDDTRDWWPGAHSQETYPLHHT